MRDDMAWLRRSTAALVGLLVALITGFVGLTGFFSDLGPSETGTERIVLLLVSYAVGCGLVGALLPRAWYFALIAAWGPVLIALPGLVNKVVRGGPFPFWSFLLEALVAVPAAALVFGYAGSWLRKRLFSSSAAAT